MVERISRREAFKAITLALTGIDLALYGYPTAKFLERLYPFTGLIDLETPKVKAAELNISWPEAFKLKDITVGINKDEISKALLLAAKTSDPVFGQAKVRELLEKRPLKITMGGKPPLHYYKGVPYHSLASYRPYLLEGPEIIFYTNYLSSYLTALRPINLVEQKNNEGVIYHEISHFLQDIRKPFGFFVDTIISGVRENANALSFVPQFAPWEKPTEVDAQRKATILTDIIFDEYVRETTEGATWPFGRSFIFYQVQ